ncbi:ferritin family protein [Bacillus salinus]|uniref:ferritin family protein n=1 Tax=Bacillus sp. HMF5848 TaxID=2495421 RepID=UPI001639F594|nr:ferritin family protein [Bacillus sp. HMF5848]
MKKNILVVTCVIICFLLPLHTAFAVNYGAKAALADDSITLEEALTYAIQDEYLAQARYDVIMGKFRVQQPFSRIKTAEAKHIAALERLFKINDLSIPENNASKFVQAPETLKEAYEMSIQAEKDNIAMYKKLSEIDGLPSNAKQVMTNVSNASKIHLATFERGLQRIQ